MINEIAINKIKNFLQNELTKRGFHAPITVTLNNKKNSERLEVISKPFQTTPVLFKKIWIGNFNSSISEHKKYTDAFIVYIQIDAFYQNFEGGSNGISLFAFNCVVDGDNIYEEKIR